MYDLLGLLVIDFLKRFFNVVGVEPRLCFSWDSGVLAEAREAGSVADRTSVACVVAVHGICRACVPCRQGLDVSWSCRGCAWVS